MSAYVSYATGRTTLVTLTAETVLVGIVMALTFPTSVVLMPYLVVLPLLAGLFRGLPGRARHDARPGGVDRGRAARVLGLRRRRLARHRRSPRGC